MVLRYSIPHSRQNPREKDPRPVAGRNRGPRRRRDGNVFGPELSFLLSDRKGTFASSLLLSSFLLPKTLTTNLEYGLAIAAIL
jgi:hypothetical protein